MKRIIVGLGLLYSMGFASYVGVNIASENIEDHDAGTSLRISFGKVLENDFGYEFSVSKTLNNAQSEDDVDDEAEALILSGYGFKNIEISEKFIFVPKIGLSYYDIELTAPGISASESNLNISYGVGVEYKINEKSNISLDYTIFNPKYNGYNFDASQLSLGYKINF